jgi:ribonuclease P protein component
MPSLSKAERLHHKKIIEQMFTDGSRSFAVYPLRVVFMRAEGLETPVSILISVSKRRFRHAVKRNCIKRRIREAYRKQKQELTEAIGKQGQQLAVAFIYLSDKLMETSAIEASMKTALARLREKNAEKSGEKTAP